MLNLNGPAHRYCDGVSRRGFLQIGSLALGGMGLGSLSLPELLAAQEASSAAASTATTALGHKAVIMVYLAGGLAHQDTFDLKVNAPVEIRGEFQPIETSIPGVQFSELLPQLARSADKLAVLRSIVGLRDEHSSFQNTTGFPMDQSQREGKPHFGTVINRLQGPVDPVVPPFVDLFPTMQHRPYNSAGAGYLGRAFSGVTADGEDLANMRLRDLNLAQLGDRRSLLNSLDEFRREADRVDTSAMSNSYQHAFEVLTSSKLVTALDLEREDPKLRDRYGRGSSKHLGDGAPMWNDQLLAARRLIETGVRCVTVAYGFWDTHGNNFKWLRDRLPLFDQGISALVEDIHERGLANDVTVLVWGEFGRTPKINKDAGRDHWAPVNSALFAGGGLRTGQVIGSTDKLGAYAQHRPVHYHDVLATVYHSLGIDPHTFVQDRSARPVGILPEHARIIPELV